jgi:hypothetical protein
MLGSDFFAHPFIASIADRPKWSLSTVDKVPVDMYNLRYRRIVTGAVPGLAHVTCPLDEVIEARQPRDATIPLVVFTPHRAVRIGTRILRRPHVDQETKQTIGIARIARVATDGFAKLVHVVLGHPRTVIAIIILYRIRNNVPQEQVAPHRVRLRVHERQEDTLEHVRVQIRSRRILLGFVTADI